MADLYNVFFTVDGEPGHTAFEFQTNAEHIADVLAGGDDIDDVRVTDEFAADGDCLVYVPENDSGDEVTDTDETCDNCGTALVRIEPDEDVPGDADVCYLCPPDDGCGMVNRYEDSDGNVVE